MPTYRISLPEAPEEEYEIDAPEGADFTTIANSIRQKRAQEKSASAAKKALDKAVEPVGRSLAEPIFKPSATDSPNVSALKRYAGGLAGPTIGALAGSIGGPAGAVIGALGGIGAQSPAELALTAVPSPKLPVKLPGALGKLFGPSTREAVPDAVKKLLPKATPYAPAVAARVANLVKGGAEGAAEGALRSSALRAMRSEDPSLDRGDAIAGGVLGGIAGAANVAPIKKTLKQQADVELGTIDEKAQKLREAKLAAVRQIEKQREEATKIVRPNTTQLKTEITAKEAAAKALEDTISARHGTVKSDKELLLAKEAALDQITAERAAQGKTRPTKAQTQLKQDITDLKTKLATADAEEAAEYGKLKTTKDELNKARTTLTDFTSNPQDFDAKVKMMVDDYLAATPSRVGSKKTKAELETELLDQINKGELDMEKLAGKVRELSALFGKDKRDAVLGSVTGELAYHAYQGVRTGPVRAVLGGLGAAIARSDPEKRARMNAWLSRIMSNDVLQNVNKFMEGTINKLNEVEEKRLLKEIETEEEEPETPTASSRQELLDAIATQEGYYDEDPKTRARRNKNPGNLRGAEGFYMYPSDEEGFAALGDLLQRNSGKTLAAYIAQHAPASDNNDPEAYTRNVIKRLREKGIEVDENTLIEQLLAQ